MEYTKTVLKGYERLSLNHIEQIEIQFQSGIHLILGSNGSGKSSLLREMTPLPSSRHQYKSGGYKYHEITHRGSEYQITNTFEGRGETYSMIKDGVELAKGMTATSFRALVQQEFGITPAIQSLIDGVLKFSTMDVAKRREWFTMMSAADYTYAFKYYGSLKSRIRDLQGSVTISQNRIAQELSKVIKPEEEHEIRARVAEYREMVDKLLSAKPHLSMQSRAVIDALRGIETRLVELRQRFDKTRVLHQNDLVRHGLTMKTEEDLKTLKAELLGKRAYAEQVITENKEKLSKFRDTVKDIELFSSVSLSDIDRDIKSYQAWYAEGVKRLIHPINLKDPTSVMTALEAAKGPLESWIDTLPSGDLTQYTRAKYEEHREIVATLTPRLQTTQAKLQEVLQHETDYGLLKMKAPVECPKCLYAWHQGYEEVYHQQLVRERETLGESVSRMETLLKESKTFIQETETFYNAVGKIKAILQNWPPQEVWEIVKAEECFPYRTDRILQIISEVITDLPLHQQLQQAQSKISELSALRLNVLDTQSKDNDRIIKEVAGYEERLSEAYSLQRTVDRDLRVIEGILPYYGIYREVETHMTQTLASSQKYQGMLGDTLRADHLNRLINIFRLELSDLEHQLSKIDIQKALIDQLEGQVLEMQKQIKLLIVAEKALSPSKGLIAKGLTGFINFFIAKVNLFVKKIWTYPLEILPVELDDGALDLNYKFPVKIDDRFTAPDVKVGECNNSTCEVFDLAFRVVAMECLGFSDFPLQLDEFGASFDHKHRELAFQTVTSLIANSNIPQIFMVSHAEQSYGSLKNCDVTLLHDANVVIPTGVVCNGRTRIS